MQTNSSFSCLGQIVGYRARGYLLPVILLLSMISVVGVRGSRWSAKSKSGSQGTEHGVRVIPNEKERRIDVIIDGEPFTSYIWPETLMKPVLYPVRTAKGTVVTRGFPLEPRAGESVDHPHQVGLWFNYGDVNGIDFWNNSTVRTAAEKSKMGRIEHRRIVSAKNGKDSGELEVEMDWLMPDDSVILHERTKFIFYGLGNVRSIDRLTTLTALDRRVIFNDSKEGMLGLRVRRELEQRSKEPILLTDASGHPAAQPVLDNSGVSGQYRSSEGLRGDEVWGTRGRWAILSGTVGQEPITLAILDHPKNVGYPTYWMARGYGLFAANPLGQKAFSTEKKDAVVRELKFTLEAKQSTEFRYRVLILSASATDSQVEAQYHKFNSEGK
jgi:Methane oxygenase PmoA